VETFEERVNPTGMTVASLGDMYENGSAGIFRFTRTDTTDTFSVSFSLGGTANGMDYSWMPMVTFTSGGSLTADLVLSPWNDSTAEGTETISVALLSSSPWYTDTGTATMNLYDDDTVQVTVAKQGSDPTEGSNGTFRISRSGSTSGNLTVNFTTGGTATSGTDYTSIGTSATITSGNSYVDVTVTTIDDFSSKEDESATIQITDGGSVYTAYGTSAVASMAILDLNHAPVIEEDQEFELLDGIEVGMPVGTVAASDADIDQTITFSIISGNTDGAFEINEDTGLITIANASAIDYDSNPFFTLTIHVADSAGTPLTTTETVVVTLVQFVDDSITTEPQVVAALNDIYAKIIQLRDVGGLLVSNGSSYLPLNPSSSGSTIASANSIISQMAAVPDGNLNSATPYFGYLWDLGTALSHMEATVFTIAGLATEAMRLSEGDRVRQDGVMSLLAPIENWVESVHSALSSDYDRLATVNLNSLGTQPWTLCHQATEGLFLARLWNMQVSLDNVWDQTSEEPITDTVDDFLNVDIGGGINGQQAIMAAVDYSYVYASAYVMIDKGDIMLANYNNAANGYLLYNNAFSAYYNAEDALLGGADASAFGNMGVMLNQVAAAIGAAENALYREDEIANGDGALNGNAADLTRRQGIRARLESMQGELNSIAGLLSDIISQSDAIYDAVSNTSGREFAFSFPDHTIAVIEECNRAYYGFTDGVVVKGIEGYLADIADLIQSEF
jgi:hypothetical protein